MGPTYTLGMTNLVGPLQEIVEFSHQLLIMDLLPHPFLRGLLVTFVNISNIFSQVHVVVGFSTNSNTKAMIIISDSYKTYPHTFQL